MTEKATFAAGCFWGVEDDFRKIPGVIDAVSGYTGGTLANPTYAAVCTGRTGHAESVEVTFDPQRVSYRELVDHFFESHNPTTPNRQGPDFGTQYRSAIYTHSAAQAAEAKAALERAEAHLKQHVVTEIAQATKFYPAEDYHQRYFERQGISHCAIR
jgi:peptide-methionine (S)-S-oxide reductase